MLIINGSGATTLMEQLIVYRAAVKELAKQDIEVVANFVGEMLTVQEQAGFQMFMAQRRIDPLGQFFSFLDLGLGE